MIDLHVRRSAAELLDATFAVFRQRWYVFLTMTFLVVAPVTTLVDGVWGHLIRDGADAERSVAQLVVSALVAGVVVPASVTALHCVVVTALADGRKPGLWTALRDVAPHLVRALGVVCVYVLAVVAGIVCLIAPGVWIAIRWYFGAQAAVLEGGNPAVALRRSGDLVDGSWWRVFGLLALIGLLGGTLAVPLDSIQAIHDDGVTYLVAYVLTTTFTMSLSAIFATLLFFDLALRHDKPWVPAGHPRPPADGPEAPTWSGAAPGYAPPGFEPPRPPEPQPSPLGG